MAVVAASLSVAAVIAALPFFGISQFVFAKDYCTVDIQDTPYAVVLLLAFLATATLVTVGHLRNALRSSAALPSRRISVAAVVLFLWGWVAAAVIAMYGLAAGSSCDDPFTTTSPVYGFNAIFLHVQQMANPILYVMFWRPLFPTSSSHPEENGKQGEVDVGAQGRELPGQQAA